MKSETLSRRGFAGIFGAALGATLLETRLGSAAASGVSGKPGAEPEGPVRLSANENPYGPSEKARRAIERSIGVGHRYPDALAEKTKQAIAASHGVRPEQVVLGCGSSQILQMADSACLDGGKTVVAAEPTFEAVLAYAAEMRAEAVKVPQTADFRHDLDKMAAACDARAGLVYVCNPNNPTGTIVSGDELEAFLSRVPPTATVLVDEAYHHLVEDPRYRTAIEMLPRHPNLVVARTFSKIYGLAGMRLGYAVASSAEAATLFRRASWDNVNAGVLAAGIASLEEKDLVPRRRKALNDTRRWLCAELDRDGRRYIPSHANFVMIDVRGDVAPVIRAFGERNIEVGRKFPSMPNWLRISIGKPEEMKAFVAGLRAIVPADRKAA